MTTQTARTNLVDKETFQTNWLQRAGLFVLFLICEAVIFIFGSHYFDVFPTNRNLTFNLGISALFFAVVLWLKYNKRWNKYWQIAFAFFVASLASPIGALTDNWVKAVLNWFAVTYEHSK